MPRARRHVTNPTGTATSPLLRLDWRYVRKPDLDAFEASDWALLNAQRAAYMAEEQARQALDMLDASRHAPSFGYQINNYRHCLQSATMCLRDGHDEETIVVALFHDLGFICCPETHGAFAADLLAPYISEANDWMLRHHAVFQQVHAVTFPGLNPDEREKWRGHPHFDWTADFVAKYDQNAIDPAYDDLSLEDFVPMVQRVFARPPRPIPVE
jgi:predicted HD phosphohydrolase